MTIGNNASNTLYGTQFNDQISGLGGDDTLYGLGGNDILEGGIGADLLDGGDGIDTASYNTSNALVIINLGTGEASGGDAQGDHFASIENLEGSRFNDTLIGSNVANSLFGGDGIDRLFGNNGDDLLSGGDGDDILVGGAGADSLRGGAGTFDFIDYIDSNAGVTINLATGTGQGGDAQGDTIAEVEQAGGSNFNDSLVGDAGANFLRGNGGDDTLKGGGGADTLVGDVGNDTAGYLDSTVGVSVNLTTGFGSGGTAEGDRLFTIENVLGSGFNDVLTGSIFANRLTGGNGNDVLNGAGGNDDLIGGAGDDQFFVDSANDKVTEGAGEGTADRVFASVSYTLAAGVQVETLTTDNNGGTGAINLTGNELANAIFGNAGSNALKGGLGNDTLVGFGGIDAFVFNTALNGASNVDAIADFAPADDDFILSSGIFPTIAPGTLADSAFAIGAAALDAADRIIYNSATGAVLYDPDGTAGGAAVQFATVTPGLALTHADFIIV